jgi:hypothetical protein
MRQPGAMADLYLFTHIFLFAVSVPALLRLNVSRLQWLLEPERLPTPVDSARVQKITGYVNLVMSAGLPFIRPGCLTRGITLYYFLKRSGVDLSLSFGLGKVDGQYVGHCWLMAGGVPYLERRDPRPVFTEILSIPLSRPVAGRVLPKSFSRI